MVTTVAKPVASNATRERVIQMLNAVIRNPAPAGAFLLQDGTVSAPGLGFASDPSLGIRRISTGLGSLTSSSVDVLQWMKDSTGVHVGIGVTPSTSYGLYVSKVQTGSYVGYFEQLGNSSPDQGLLVKVTSTNAATSLFRLLVGSGTTLEAFGDGGISIGGGSSPGAGSLSILAALGVGTIATSPLHVSKTKAGAFVAIISQTGASAGDNGLRVLGSSAAATTSLLNVAASGVGTRLEVFGDGGVTTGGMTSPGNGWMALFGGLYLNNTTDWPVKRNNPAAVLNNGTMQINPLLAGAAGYVFIRDDADFIAMFACEGGGTPRKVDGDATRWSVTAGTASHTNVYYTGGTLTLENKTGATRTYKMLFWQTT